MKACAVIPAFNEEKSIAGVVSLARRHAARIIVVDDGSADGTSAAARAAGAEVLRHETNMGKGAAIRDGLAAAYAAGFDPVVLLDGDAQHDADEIPSFLAAARESGADIVVGNRMGETKNMPGIRRLTNRFTSWCISRLAGQRIPDSQCGYRLVSERAFRTMGFAATKYDAESEMLIEAGRAGCRIASVPVKTIYAGERSRINPVIDSLRFFKLLLRHLRSRR